MNVLSPSPESTVNPAPSAAASSAAPVATWKFLSSIATVVLLMVVVVPFTVKLPETVKLSSTVTVPPAESITKFPVEVSISLSLVTPTCTLSILAPPLASTEPVMVTLLANVEFPVTSIPAVKSWLPVDVIGPFSVTATDADPFSIVVLSIAVVLVFVI